MSGLLYGSMLLVGVLGLAQLLIWAGQAYIARQDNNRAREFRRVVLFAEAEAFRAANRNREASEAVNRG